MTREPSRRAVVWSARALADLQAIRDYIGADAPLAAQRFTSRLVNAAESLADMPDRGREVGRGVHELAVIYPYLIRYTVSRTDVEIVRIRHGSRRPTR